MPDCSSRLKRLTDEVGSPPAVCALPPLDPSNIQAACGIPGVGDFPNSFTSTPDIALPGMVWEDEVNCVNAGSNTTQCSVSQAMIDALIDQPQALLGGAFLDLNRSNDAIEILECNLTSACTLLGLGEGDAIIGLGEQAGIPSDPDVALRALSELLNSGFTSAYIQRGDRQLIYQIILR